ncbi:hypothetical protein LN042_21600 [Kitasatospora sp. RB6PN24]|uniref:hypothetical protein n=1 Tax=Kitasatospora humi TaxID=2893891 RepID=UPI001E2BE5E3|nr:hypothetical protein [Kitasatospora humi]MCC9309637.1 hypothetical protein [Kitasatospora humi]
MSEGNQTPAGWPHQPAQPGLGGPGPEPTAPGGGFGPPPASYGPPQPPSTPGPTPGQPPFPQQAQPTGPWPAAAHQQPVPNAGPGAEPVQPDWEAMADRHEAESRRRRWIWAGAGVLALVLVGGGVTAFLMNDHGKKQADDHPTPTATAPAPAPATPDAEKFISSSATDKAPIDAATLFADQTRTADGKTWTRKATGITQPCSKATTGGLGLALGDTACHELVRATYVSGDAAVTVGVAVFDTKDVADQAMAKRTGQIQGLSGQGVPQFCIASGCTETHASVGRYAYFTVSGSIKQGGAMTDPDATAAGPSFADYARQQLLARATAKNGN